MEGDKDLRADLRAKYGADSIVVSKQGFPMLVFQRPSATTYARFRQRVGQKGADLYALTKQYCTDCLVHPRADGGHPDYEACTAVLEAYPALVDRVGLKLNEIAGLGSEDDDGLGKL